MSNSIIKSYKDEKGRVCTECGIYKPWSDYQRASTLAGGRKAKCRTCFNAIAKKQREAAKDEFKVHPMAKAFLIDRIHLKRAA